MLSRLPILAVLASAALAYAQTPPTTTMNLPNPSNTKTTAPYLTVQEGAHEQLSLTSGSVGLSIPVVSLPQRGGRSLDLGFVLSNNTFGLKEDEAAFYSASLNESGGDTVLAPSAYNIASNYPTGPWSTPLRPNLPYLTADLSYAGEDDPPPSGNVSGVPQTRNDAVYCVQNFVFTDWSGAAHPFHGVLDCAGPYTVDYSGPHSYTRYVDLHTLTFESYDGSYYILDARNASDIKVTGKDGTVYHFAGYQTPQQRGISSTLLGYIGTLANGVASSIVDPNGNAMSIAALGSGGYTITDTVGRKINVDVPSTPAVEHSIAYQATSGASTAAPVTATVSGTTSSVNYGNLTCTYDNAGSSQYGNYTPRPPSISYASQGTAEASETVTLPNGALYQMAFNAVGQMSQITYPSGGYTRYDYAPVGTTIDFSDVTCQAVPYNVLTAKHECHASNGSCTQTPSTTTYGGACSAGAPSGGEATTCYVGGVSTTYGWKALDVQDPVGNTTHYDFQPGGTVVTSLGQSYGSEYLPSYELDRKYYSGASTLLRTVATDYTANANCPQFSSWREPCKITTTYNDASPSALSSVVTMQYDTVGAPNPTQKVEQDFSGNTVRTTASTWEHSGIYADQAPSGSAPGHILDHPASRTVTEAAQGKTHATAYNYDAVGNLSSTTETGTNAPQLVTQYAHNGYGDLTQVTDPKNNPTSYGYANPFTDGACSAVSDSAGVPSSKTNALSQTTSYKYYSCTGQLAAMTDPNGTATATTYDTLGRSLGSTSKDSGSAIVAQDSYSYQDTAPLSVTHNVQRDAGDAVTTVATLDGFGKLLQSQLTTDPIGADITDYTYDGLERELSVSNPHRSGAASTDGITTYTYDALGRVTNTALPDGNSTHTTFQGVTADFYDQKGNHTQRSSDALGRLTTVIEPDPASNALASETDYAYDGFDNLTQVDQLGSLGGSNTSSCLSPSGAAASGAACDRRRTFSYDGLSRLLSSTNPEAGTIGYGYDNDNNVQTRTDARGIATTYSYDGLNRVTGKSYSDGTPAASFTYDVPVQGWNFIDQAAPAWSGVQQHNLVGRLSYENNASSTIVYGYDGLGRTTLKSECTPATCGSDHYDMHAAYDWAGNPTFTDRGLDAARNAASPNAGYYYGGLALAYNNASQTTSANSDVVDANHPQGLLGSMTYTPLGGVLTAELGSQYGQIFSYDKMGRLTDRASFNLQGTLVLGDHWNFDPAGNVLEANDSQQGDFTYVYDALNRVTHANIPPFSEDYGYDAWGNQTAHTVTDGASIQWAFTPTTQNRASNPGASYDAAGNMLTDGNHTYTYDAENRTTAVTDQGVAYRYDPDGKRVATLTGGAVTVEYLYDMSGSLVTTVNAQGQLVRSILRDDQGTHWGDWIGAAGPGGIRTEFRLVNQVGTLVANADTNGNFIEGCLSGPFGDGQQCTGSYDYTETHFVDKLRDQETANDYFDARYFNSIMSRFLSPDDQDVSDNTPEAIPHGAASNPQTLNLYSYTQNNPLSHRDYDGHASWQDCGDGSGSRCWTGDYNGEQNNGLFWNSQSKQWQGSDPNPPPANDPAGIFFTGLTRTLLGQPYGFTQMGQGVATAFVRGGGNPVGMALASVIPAFIPKNWIEKPTNKGRGIKYVDPNNPHNSVRLVPAEPGSSNPGQQRDYMMVTKNGQTLDANGNAVPRQSLESHIPQGTQLPEDLFGPIE